MSELKMNNNQSKCPRCGKINEHGTRYCIYCGKKIYDEPLFSLRDALIIFIVVGILSAIAIPNFFRYPCGSKNSPLCRQGEAKRNLAAIFTAYTSYHSDYGTYPSSPLIVNKGEKFDCLSVTTWEPIEPKIYNYNCMNTNVFRPHKKDTSCPAGVITNATKDSFTVAACGNLDKDSTLDVWTIDDQKHLRNIINDIKE